MDVWGPTKRASLGGHRFFVLSVDEFFRRNWVYTLRHKGEVLEVFVKWKKLMENQTDRKINLLQSDHNEEYEGQFLRFG